MILRKTFILYELLWMVDIYLFQQIKYLTVLKGKILDCVVDLRKNSKTFGKSYKILLSEKNGLSIYVPAGLAHSYLALDKENIEY